MTIMTRLCYPVHNDNITKYIVDHKKKNVKAFPSCKSELEVLIQCFVNQVILSTCPQFLILRGIQWNVFFHLKYA